jgi:ABC-type Fe3+-siderophore transport system permease subunit
MSSPAPSSPAASPLLARRASAASALVAIWLASAAVLATCVLAAFRLEFAQDLATLWRVNGPRVLFAAAAGGALALAGALRLAQGSLRPLGELERLALTVGAAGGGFVAVGGRAGVPALLAFAAGALAGAGLLFGAVRALDRPRRSANLGVAVLLAALIGAAALTGTYARARRDLVAPAVAWLLGDLAGASFASGAAMLAVLLGLSLAALRAGARARLALIAPLALGLGIGAAGPLAFVGTFAPRCVRWLARGASARALTATSVAAGAAAVAAIDAVPRLLVGGYDFPFNVPAALLAVPIFLGWNRARLRGLAGGAGRAFEALELALISGMTLVGVYLAFVLARVIAFAT